MQYIPKGQEVVKIIKTYADLRHYSHIGNHLVYGFDLNESDIRITQPSKIKIPLKPHQLTKLYRMMQMEKDKGFYYQYEGEDEKLFHKFYTNFACDGDKTGFGKTITACAIVSNDIDEPSVRIKLAEESKFNFYEYQDIHLNKMEIYENYMNTTLVVVPFGAVFKQWEKTITEHTSLKYLPISKKRDYNIFTNIIKNDKLPSWDDVSNREITRKKIKERLDEYDIILVSSTFIKDFLSQLLIFVGIKMCTEWKRIIIDEADSINIPGFYVPKSKFSWFITASYSNLPFAKCKNISSIFGQINRYMSNEGDKSSYYKLIIKNNEKYLEQSFKLPEYITHNYICHAPNIVKTGWHLCSQKILSTSVVEMLNSGDYEGAIKSIGGQSSSEDDLIGLLTNDSERQIENKKKELEYVYILDISPIIKDARIKSINTNIKELEEKVKILRGSLCGIKIWDEIKSKFSEDGDFSIKNILSDKYNGSISEDVAIQEIKKIFIKESNNDGIFEKRVLELINKEEELCGICCGFYNNPTVLKCKHIYCASCIFNWITSQQKKNRNGHCPYCKTFIDMKDLNIVKIGKKEKEKEKEMKKSESLESIILSEDKGNVKTYKSSLDKIDTVMNIILKRYKNGRFIIYSMYDKFGENLTSVMKKHEITYKPIKGIGGVKAIEEFKSGKIKVIYLNSQYNGAGIELTEATDIIVMNKMKKHIQTQIIGRAQRMGRVNTLNVHNIIYDQE